MKIPEKAIIKSIKHFLKLQSKLGNLTYNRIHTMGIMYGNGQNRKLFPNQDMLGHSDFIILSKGKIGYMEAKSKDGIISPSQLEFLKEKERHGAKTGVVYSLNEAILFIEQLVNGDMTSVGIRHNKSSRPSGDRIIRRLSFPQRSF